MRVRIPEVLSPRPEPFGAESVAGLRRYGPVHVDGLRHRRTDDGQEPARRTDGDDDARSARRALRPDTVTIAVVMTAVIRRPTGVSRPAAIENPPTTSAVPASSAAGSAGRMPSPSNPSAVAWRPKARKSGGERRVRR
jgi:hypothetical protein